MTIYFNFRKNDAHMIASLSAIELNKEDAVWQSDALHYRFSFHPGHDLGQPLYFESAGATNQPYPKIDTKDKTAANFVMVNSAKLTALEQDDAKAVVRANWSIVQRLAKNYHEGVDDGQKKSYYTCTKCNKKYGPANSGKSLPDIGVLVGTYPPRCQNRRNKGVCGSLIKEVPI